MRCFWLPPQPTPPPSSASFLAVNDSILADEDGSFSDWLEIHNPDASSLDLGGYHLTDDAEDLTKWTLPAGTNLAADGYLVVFASSKNRAVAGAELHTNFKLGSSGEYLALIAPDGTTIVHEYSPTFPPQFEDESYGLSTAGAVYLDTATPGAANSGGQLAGPIFGTVTENPPQPVSGPLTITAEIAGSANPVTSVTLHYRQAFGGESSTVMNDSGTGADAIAGDSIWTATIPSFAIAPGEMTRWRFTAVDSSGVETKAPPFRDPADSHQYFGTVGADPTIETNLTVLHWFVQNPSAANNTTGTTGAVYYLGEFYDNVHFNRHGQSTAQFPKKSYNLDFNKTQRFEWSLEPGIPRVADIDLLTNWADKSKVRHPLAWELMRESGVHAHFAFTVRVEQNGQFFSTADFVEDGDDIYLKRAGLNEDGALYKVYSNTLNKDAGNTGNSGVEKKNRKSENNDDLQALIDGLDLNGNALINYMRDNIDIPKCVNMLAANSLIRNTDMQSKNWYAYRDTGKTDEWAILPWDLDLSGGRNWNSRDTYFDNSLYTSGHVTSGNGNSIRLVSQLFGNAETRQMILRRMRTLSDTFLQPSSTPVAERWFERRLDELSALIDDPAMAKSDAQLDFEKWGSWLQGNRDQVPYTTNDPDVESMAEGVARWRTEYLPGRRNFIYNTQTVGNGGEIPLPQTDSSGVIQTQLLQAGASAFAFSPSDNTLGTTWRGAPANEPFDTSGWISGPTGFGYENSSGYQTIIGTNVAAQMATNNSLYIRVPFNVSDPSAFDSLELRMQWDDGFVAFLNGDLLTSDNFTGSLTWNSSADNALHEANASSYNIYDVTSKLSSLRAGQNVLAIHGLNDGTGSSDFVIRPELYGGQTNGGGPSQPALQFGAIEFSPASGNQDEEYIEITNPFSVAVDISDWQITGGVEHTFYPGTVITAGGSLYVSPDVNTFRARDASPTGGEGRFVQGNYSGHLSSLGETLNLLDADANLLTTTNFTGNASDAQLNLIVSEIMYHPAGDGLAEFVELTNISTTQTLDLTGVKFVDGIEFDFTGSAVTSLAPGARVLVVADIATFEAAHGTGHPVAGVFANLSRLNNDGETLKLEDSLNGTIKEFTYNDAAPWPTAADNGYSLVLVGASANPDPDLPTSWRSSASPGGNPDDSDTVTPPTNPLSDADGNGVADLIDHALGNDLGLPPIAPSFAMQSQEVAAGVFEDRPTISYPVSIGAETVTTTLLLSQDLSIWSGSPTDITIVATDNLGDGRALVTAYMNPPFANAKRLFYTIQVSD